MTSTTVPIGGTPTPDWEASVTGTGRVLADGSDLTFVTINPTSGRVDATLDPASIPHAGAGAIADPDVDVLLKVTGPDPGLTLHQYGYGGLMGRDTSVPVETLAGGWRKYRMTYVDPSRAWLGDTSNATLITSTPGSGSVVVYEASVMFTYLSSLVAPPCRNIKRGDWLDLGGARNYPPSKMQQTSSRGVGAY